MIFNNSILIIDPSFVIKPGEGLTFDDWNFTDRGENLSMLNLQNYMTQTLINNSGSYKIYSSDNIESDVNLLNEFGKSDWLKEKEILGEFIIESNKISIFNLQELENYIPEVRDIIINEPWKATIIDNFTGNIEIKQLNFNNFTIHGTGNLNFFTA